ncbi:GNAT family protein [Gaiella sp.]|uniref:GNAT family N-acetyltransferase n=1 Tax=Gaiella sp. TaxID=2663207 RepID=UPI003264A42D
MIDLTPLSEVRLRTPRLELRLGTPEEIDELGQVAARGIHGPDEMPFSVPWTDGIGQPDFHEGFAGFHRSLMTDWSPDDWHFDLLVWADDELLGNQELYSKGFRETSVVGSGSWLGTEFQGRGIGTEMRAAVLDLAFRGLGAVAATSGWLEGNRSSARVSEKLGYVETGIGEISPRGVPVPHHDLRLDRKDWVSPFPVEIIGLEPALPVFGAA